MPNRLLAVDTKDGWTTEHHGAEAVHIEGDELVFEHESELFGRSVTRIDLNDVRGWALVEHHTGLER